MNIQDELIALAARRAITRRDFMRASAAAGISLATAGSLFSNAYAATPARGGVLRMGIGGGESGDSLDPLFLLNSFTQFIGASIHNCLTEIDTGGRLAPELALGWEPSADVTTWTFQLRPGVTFHNGKTLDAEDVVGSINYHRGPDSSSTVKGIVDQIADVSADGPHVVRFTLHQGNADFPVMMSDFRLAIMPTVDGRPDPGGVGCGGYVVRSFEPGVRATLERFADYWKPDRAWFDAVEMISIKDAVARQNALLTGAIDIMDRCDVKVVHLMEQNPDLRVVSVTGTQHYTSPMLSDTAPFDDVNVRLALKYAIDREAWLRTVLRGHGQVGNDHPISPANRYFAADLEQRVYDPDRAKWYLKQSGLDQLRVDLHASDAAFNGCVDAAVLYRESARKAGIDINVIREPADGYWSNVWMNKGWSFSYWGGRPTEDWMFSSVYAADAGMNESRWNNPRFNELLVAARVELDETRRREMYGEMQMLVRDDGGSVIPLFANYVNAMTNRVSHGQIASNWDLDGFRAAERWWFA
jgi:peptide/nickel transport system substrate-binding protein